MDPLIVFLRLLHIVLGIYWAGTIFFFVTFLEPSVRGAGPEGGKVMFQLFSRRYLDILPVIAALTILSGVGLMWKVSGGFAPSWMGSRLGIVLSLGGAAAILGFIIGFAMMRPAALRIFALMQAMPQTSDETARQSLMSEMAGLRARTKASARLVAILLLIASVAMAAARYM
jgi:hypothetical protein